MTNVLDDRGSEIAGIATIPVQETSLFSTGEEQFFDTEPASNKNTMGSNMGPFICNQQVFDDFFELDQQSRYDDSQSQGSFMRSANNLSQSKPRWSIPV